MFLRSDDVVEVIAGDDKGMRGKVLRVLSAKNQVVVEGVNRAYRHLKPSKRNPQGGRLSKEMPVDASNVQLVDPVIDKPTRVGVRYLPDGSKELYSKKSKTRIRLLSKPNPKYARELANGHERRKSIDNWLASPLDAPQGGSSHKTKHPEFASAASLPTLKQEPPMPDRFLEEDSAELLSRLRFSQLSLTDRLAVLSEIAARNDVQGISDYLVQELEKANLPLEWLVGLLTAAEEVTHSDETLCRLLSDQLLQRVQELRVRRSEDPVLAETAIAAAFRTFGLIAPLDQADRLAAFIDPADSSISQKTFIAIRALFSAQGPESQLAPLELSAKVGDYLKRGFAEKPLSASRFGHLTTGVLAAVALGEADRQVVPVLPQLLDWQKEFLSRRLGEIRQDWQATKTGADPERLAQLQACLKILDSNLVGKS